MDIYLRNDTGNWATVKRVSPTMVNSKIGDCITSNSAIGMITIDRILPKEKHSSNDIRSMMIVMSDKNIQEFYGLTIFEMDGNKNWMKQVDGILEKKSTLKIVHPKTASDDKNYLFFANRYNVRNTES